MKTTRYLMRFTLHPSINLVSGHQWVRLNQSIDQLTLSTYDVRSAFLPGVSLACHRTGRRHSYEPLVVNRSPHGNKKHRDRFRSESSSMGFEWEVKVEHELTSDPFPRVWGSLTSFLARMKAIGYPRGDVSVTIV